MTVTQVHQMATYTPLKDPKLTLPSRRRQLKTTSGRDVSASEEDVTLGIFEDGVEGEDVTDSDADYDVARGRAMPDNTEHPSLEEAEALSQQNQVGIEVSISRRSKEDGEDGKHVLIELPLTVTSRSDRSEDSYHNSGFQAKVTTTGSLLSERSEAPTCYDRQSQGACSASREVMFQQALTLMSQRCVSVAQAPRAQQATSTCPQKSDSQLSVVRPHLRPPSTAGQLSAVRSNTQLTLRCTSNPVPENTTRRQHPADHKETPQFGSRVISVNQTRPSAMPPLKAWRGFSGNVYFEPIKVKSVSQSSALPPGEVKVTRGYPYGAKLPGATSEQNAASAVPAGSSAHPVSAQSSPPVGFSRSQPSNASKCDSNAHGKVSKKVNKMVIVDKGIVYSSNFDSLMLSDDIEWVVGGAAPPPPPPPPPLQHQQQQPGTKATIYTGSLVIQRQPLPELTSTKLEAPAGTGAGWVSKEGGRKFQYKRERICRGSVVHRAFFLKDRPDVGAVFTAKSIVAPNTRISPLWHTINMENPDTTDTPCESSRELANKGRLPPLDTITTTTPRSRSNRAMDNLNPLANIILSSNQIKSSVIHNPHPQGKPYVK